MKPNAFGWAIDQLDNTLDPVWAFIDSDTVFTHPPDASFEMLWRKGLWCCMPRRARWTATGAIRVHNAVSPIPARNTPWPCVAR